MSKKMIYSNYNLFSNKNEEYAIESLLDYNKELKKENITEEMINNEIYNQDKFSLQCERENLDIQLSNPIIAIASLGLWNGRTSGHNIIESGNIKDILYSECDYCEWYIEKQNLRSRQSHHDGTNYIEYREIKDNVDIDILLNDIYKGKEISRSRLNYYTKSIVPEVNEVYGW